MNQQHDPREGNSYFHPIPKGCMAKDQRFARALESLYINELTAMAQASYWGMLCEGSSRRMADQFYEQMNNAIAHFRLLGEMILALGGNPAVRCQIRVEALPIQGEDDCPDEICARVLVCAVRWQKRSIDLYQTLLGRTEDRVARSLLLQLLSVQERYLRHLERVQK